MLPLRRHFPWGNLQRSILDPILINIIIIIICFRNFAVSNGVLNLPVDGRNGFCELCFYKKAFGSSVNHSCVAINPVIETLAKQPQCGSNENETSENSSNILFSI